VACSLPGQRRGRRGRVLRASPPRRLAESPTFARLQEANEVVKFPLTVFARYYWKSFFRIVFCHFYGITSTAVTVFGLAYATTKWDIAKSSLLWALGVFPSIAIVMMKPGPLGWLSVAILPTPESAPRDRRE
jgi:hypothetical protein